MNKQLIQALTIEPFTIQHTLSIISMTSRIALGRLHLNSNGEYFEEVIFFPSSFEVFGMDATFGCFLLLE